MKRHALSAVLVLSLLGAAATALGPARASGELELASVAWMTGHWMQEKGGGTVEELWLPPRGGMMLGLNRTSRSAGKGSFEYLRIAQSAEGKVVYWASPGGGLPTPFELVEADGTHAVFSNPEHDFPKRIEYRLDGEKLTASIAGDTPGPSWTFVRVGDVR